MGAGCRICGAERVGDKKMHWNWYFDGPKRLIPESLDSLCVAHILAFARWFGKCHKSGPLKWRRDPTDDDVVEWLSVVVMGGSRQLSKGLPAAFCQESQCRRWAVGIFDGIYLCSQHKAVKERGNRLIISNNHEQPITKAVNVLLGRA